MKTICEVSGVRFYCSPEQAVALKTLTATQKGGFARVNGYVSENGRVTPETSNITFLSRFNLEALYTRKIKALDKLSFGDCKDELRKVPKLKGLDEAVLRAAFHARVQDEIASMQKTLDGIRDDERRRSHDRNYLSVGAGIKVHFVTEKSKVDGLTYPVCSGDDGLPTVKNIMVSAIEISRQVLTEGKYKPVNSGVPKLISNVIATKLPRSTKIKTLSLGDENFASLQIDGKAVMPADIAGDFSND